MTQYGMTIGGESVKGEGAFDVVNPATGQVYAQAPDCSAEQLDAAFESARTAYRGWKDDLAARRAALHAAGDLLMAKAQELAPVLTAEQGKPLGEAAAEVFGAGYWLKHHADMAIPHDVIRDDAAARVEVVRRPMGVVAAITPWNFPLMLACWKIAPALLAGNTMVLKPSPYTPLTTLAVGELLADVLPSGVLNVVSGRDPLGARMTAHPVPRKVSFTGSVATGKRVAASAADDLKRVTLELGGNDPAIVLPDADPAVVGPKLFDQAFLNNGQICSAVKRVYVPDNLHDELVEAIAACAREAKVGDGTVEGVRLGPLNNAPQRDRVAELVADALARGATAVTGGKAVDGPGYFHEPTIIAGASDGFAIVDEEQFGPALPIVRYASVEEAVERANGTHFGLGGSVWSADEDRAYEVASSLECGTAWVNTHLALHPGQPFGGFGWSGVGTENGPWGLEGFTEVQVRHRAKL
ncbi:aldehyde dehydrogenase family protein [Actinocorallia sp. A-T 12471]|uniref:aldehyde dehydrogenase family protein n=1 Tax=Actinocorallia sp. A-T 12471 TaxID=3089813 RepID=UPI0029D1F91C|nr:aldehyde dehydrogenase family protein [Actinocorallia sp. A-T 12471]MDX6740485.1 aldehyde dehydrogenase family protein [Actinocorallia sp. A-T 12471]